MNEDGQKALQRMLYLPVSGKFLIALIGASAWMGFSIWAAGPWFADLQFHVGLALAIFLVYGIAIIPGFMNAFLAISLVLDKRPPHRALSVYPPISILVAAYNEEASIEETNRVVFTTGARVQNSHKKVDSPSRWGHSENALCKIYAASRRGVDVMADQYAYTAARSSLGIRLTSCALEGGQPAVQQDPQAEEEQRGSHPEQEVREP